MVPNQSGLAPLTKTANRQYYTQLLECLEQLLEDTCVPGVWGTVSFEVFIEDGKIQRFRENFSRSHKLEGGQS